MRTDKNKATEIRRILGITSALILMLVLISLAPTKSKAAASISVKEINYQNSTITLQLNEGDTEVYFSESSKKTWEEVPGSIQSNKTIVMDISWVVLNKNYVLYFKGNNSTSVISVTIPKQASNFSATFNKIKGTISFKNAGRRSVEWRKKGSTTWKAVDNNTIASEISLLYANGAIVYFRLAPLNGTSITNIGFRPSREASITIPKKPAAPNITINGSKFSISLKKGMAYRTVNKDGTTTDWITVGRSSDLLLKNIAPSVLYNASAVSPSAITMQFRTNAKSTALMSKTASLTIPIQEGPPSTETYGISLSYTSSSSVSLQVKAASNKLPFEYTIVKEGIELNYLTADWTAITSSSEVNLDSTKAKAGSHIYVRKKSTGSFDNSDYALASAEIDVSGISGLVYPGAPTPTTLTTLISTAGVCKTSKVSSHLSFSIYSATSTTVSSISFDDTYGINRGTVTSKSTVAKNSNSSSSADKYIITTKITSTENIDNVTEELLFAKITLANSDVITSTSNAGLLLYLYPKTIVKNPTEKDYTADFKRVYLSNDAEDAVSFKFRLELGTLNVIDPSAIAQYTSTKTAIGSIKYDTYTLNPGTDYMVDYSSYVNDNNDTIATATVTINVASFESSSLIDITDKAAPLEIYLNNNEVLDEEVLITLKNTATLKDIPIAWAITEGSLKETETSTVTNTDKTTTTVTVDKIDYVLELNIFSSSYSVSVSDVTWGNTSIFSSAKISGGKAIVYLSNAKINKLTTDSTTTNNVVITLSNGFKIRTGCKLTIINAS